MSIVNKVLFILDDKATEEEIRNSFESFCDSMKNTYPAGTLFVPSNLRALEKIPDWQKMVELRTKDTPSPDARAQLYTSAVIEAMQGKKVYMMVRKGDGWSYRIANPDTDYSPLNEGRIDPRPRQLEAIE